MREEGSTIAPPQPAPPIAPPYAAVEYAGFWIRLVASIIDLVIVLIGLALLSVLAPDSLTGLALSALYYVLLTGLRGQTVGKMTLGIRVVRADGRLPGLGYAALREVVGKFVSAIALFLGFLWIAWDREKQGWHDKIAGTRVIKVRRRSLQSTAAALMTLEDLLGMFEAQDLVGALRQLNEPSDGSKETLVERLLEIDERLETIRPDESVLEAFDARALKRVCQSIGLGSGDKAQMVKALEGVLV